MSNATEQIFLLNPPDGQATGVTQKNPGPTVQTQINLHDIQDFSSVCRTCATVTQYVIPIFEGDGLENNLADKIHKHLPIQVSETDVLPRVVCYQCASTLLAWHELVQCCVQADAALRTRLGVAPAVAVSAPPAPHASHAALTPMYPVASSPGVSITIGPGVSFSAVAVAPPPVPAQAAGPAPAAAAPVTRPRRERPARPERPGQTVQTGRATQTDPEPSAKCATDMKREQNNQSFKCEKYICAQLKDILIEYHPTISVKDDTLDIEFVCQKCEDRPCTSNIKQLAGHIQTMHTEIIKSSDIKQFVENYVTLEETLSSGDSDRDVISEPVVKQPGALPNFFCPFCESIFSSPTRLMCHLNQHIGVTLKRGVECCDVTFDTKKKFVNHLQEHHVCRVLEEPANVCRTCGYAATDLQDLQNHISCSHNVQDKTESSKNRKEPSGKNQKLIPAVCPECNKVFSNKYNMFVHLKSHSEVPTKFTCDVCSNTYSSRGNLRSHQKLVHEGVLKHACSVCGEAFPTRQARAVHERLHSGARPYACHVCPKAFRSRLTLDRHLEMHLDIRKHMCHICPKKFRKKSHLICHVGTHKGDT